MDSVPAVIVSMVCVAQRPATAAVWPASRFTPGLPTVPAAMLQAEPTPTTVVSTRVHPAAVKMGRAMAAVDVLLTVMGQDAVPLIAQGIMSLRLDPAATDRAREAPLRIAGLIPVATMRAWDRVPAATIATPRMAIGAMAVPVPI